MTVDVRRGINVALQPLPVLSAPRPPAQVSDAVLQAALPGTPSCLARTCERKAGGSLPAALSLLKKEATDVAATAGRCGQGEQEQAPYNSILDPTCAASEPAHMMFVSCSIHKVYA